MLVLQLLQINDNYAFIAIIVNAEISLNADKSDGTELNSWMLLLLRFTTNNNE